MDVHKIESVVKSISNVNSKNFFDDICLSLSNAIDADFVFIATIDGNKKILRLFLLQIKGLIHTTLLTRLRIRLVLKLLGDQFPFIAVMFNTCILMTSYS